MKRVTPKKKREAARAAFYDEVSRGPVTIAHAIRTVRKFLGMTQVEYAAHADVALRTLKEIERGVANPRLDTLRRLLVGTGLDVVVGLAPPAPRRRSFLE